MKRDKAEMNLPGVKGSLFTRKPAVKLRRIIATII
jgi:hypothetical protein